MGRIVLGDVIVSINGAPVTSNGSLRTLLEDHSAGDTVRVGIQRGRRQLELEVELTPFS
jgi:S1-C subfamily serine protease